MEPAPRRNHRALRRVAAVITALVVAGGVVGVSVAARRAVPPAVDPTVSAQTRAPDDPTDALEQIRAQDAPAVAALAESWVAQLSARPVRSSDGTATDAAVLAGHDALRAQHPGAVLLRSTDWNYDGEFWVTVMNERFSSADDANRWCDTQRFRPQDCFAKRLSHSGVVPGSTRYRR